MKIKAQMGMVLNLDKCLGCHTCSLPCKNVWTTAPGTEYMWYNNVETKPGIGYPKEWENQERWKGGWKLRRGHLSLAAGNRAFKLAAIFANPDLPLLDDYYEPWTYDYQNLAASPPTRHQPIAKALSVVTGKPIDPGWGPTWEDDLAGVPVTGLKDVNFRSMEAKAFLDFQNVFMLHVPRLCEHCMNPACLASCPSGAIYKRDEDGIVLINQEKCRGWRYCVSGCPYKKSYFNWKTSRSEKCIFCYPRIEAGLPTLCAHSCVGRIRYIGVVLYDADRVREAAETPREADIYEAQLSLFLDANDPAVARQARLDGIPDAVIEAASRSPVHTLAVKWRLALPLHPEFRTLPMVWYVPPLSPLTGGDLEDGMVLDFMRIPVRYLANMLTAGDEGPVRQALCRLLALRRFMRTKRVEKNQDHGPLEEAGLTPETAEAMYRLLAVARLQDRFVIPTTRREFAEDVQALKASAGFPGGRT